MAFYPIQVTSNDLYESGTTRKYPLGAVGQFKTDYGMVEARYVANYNTGTATTGSILAGIAVGWKAGYSVNTANMANTLGHGPMIAGVMAASLPLKGYGWCVFNGPITNAFMAATNTISAAERGLSVNASGQLGTSLTTEAAASNVLVNRFIGVMRANTADLASGTGHAHVVDIRWR